MATTRLLRRLRSLFGIRAAHVSIRPRMPWHWRMLSLALVLAVALALAGWIYNAGRRFAGFDSSESDALITEQKARIASLEADLAQFRSVANTSDSSIRIEKIAQEQLSSQVKTLESENLRLKEELATFESLAQGGMDDGGVHVSGLSVDKADAPGSYRYRLLVAQQAGKKDREFRGSYQLSVNFQQQGNSAMINLPAAGATDAGKYQISFQHFRRIEGSFSVPAGARLLSVEVKLMQDGAVKATQRIQL